MATQAFGSEIPRLNEKLMKSKNISTDYRLSHKSTVRAGLDIITFTALLKLVCGRRDTHIHKSSTY